MIGQRLTRLFPICQKYFSLSSRAFNRKSIRFVNSLVAKLTSSSGIDKFKFHFPKESSTKQTLEFPLDILFEDKDVIVVNKPAGLVVHSAAGHQNDTLVNALWLTEDLSMKFGEDRPGIVHRLIETLAAFGC